MKVIGYKGSSNVSTYEVSKNDIPFNLVDAGITKIEVVEKGRVLSSDTGEITFTGSTLTVKWGDFQLPQGIYYPTFYAYKSGDTKGEVLFAPGVYPITLNLYKDERP